ncbi:MAG: PQQ-binding-like beta-propeller repeat protein [Candidatus Bathyarchaeota archaeon]|nr:PQQ-binding-like beta-propeller repeat protein [Candidatus Bathyarchaeota archaeon]
MQLPNNKTVVTTIAVFLSLTIVASLALPLANAHTPPWEIPCWSYVAVQNNPAGVNQPLLIVFWPNVYPHTAQGAFGDRFTWYVDITKPDGTTETLGPITSDPVGGGYTSYTPTQVGTYTIVSRKPAHKYTGQPAPAQGPYNAAYINDTVKESISDPLYLVVQEQQIQPWYTTPLPTQFWTRPINSANREWYQVASNWLFTAAQTNGPTARFAWGTGPESAHIMWTRPTTYGGIIDARLGEFGYDTVQYDGALGFSPPIILDGKLFYNVRANPRFGWYCVDLYTGETLYFHNTTGSYSYTGGGGATYPSAGTGFDYHGSITGEALSYGQVLYIDQPNQHGGFPYLWSTNVPGKSNTWRMFDAWSGNYICDIANVSTSGTMFMDKIGSICYINIANLGTTANPKYYLQIWNTTEAIWWKTQYGASPPKTLYNGTTNVPISVTNVYWMWRPYPNVTFDGRNGYSMNVSIADIRGPLNAISNQTGTIRAVRVDDKVIVGTAGQNNEDGVIQGTLKAFSLKGPNWGQQLWSITFTPPSSAGNKTITMQAVDPEDGVFLFSCSQTQQWWGYSLETGQQIWGPTASEMPFNYYGIGNSIYMGQLLTYGYGGQIRAYDIKTGKINWTYNATNVGFESPYGGNYPIGVAVHCDGKLYTNWGEHSFTQPLLRGRNLRCIDASNGEEIWKILFTGGGMSATTYMTFLADGYLLSLNAFDAQIYCFGKGPSATTVSASPEVSVHGSSVLIKGTVTDQTPSGRRNTNGLLDFTLKGTPAISDEDMTDWMEYMFMQQPMPQNAKGVDVTLDALDPNGNFVHIGTVTSDMTGTFAKAFTPEVPGLYQIIATFAGSKSYYSSYAETFVQVDEAPPASPPPEYPQPIDTTMTIIAVGIAIIIAVAVATVLILRKK